MYLNEEVHEKSVHVCESSELRALCVEKVLRW